MYDLCEFLLRLHERGELRTDFGSLPMTVPYHAPCQQRGHGIGKPALDLLALVPDLHMIELDVDCCGIAGTYGLKKEKYEISMAVGKRLFSDINATGSDARRVRQRDLPLADRARRRRNRGASDRVALPSLRARQPSTRAGHGRCTAHTGQRVITMKRHAPRPVVEESPTGQAVMRIDDVLLSRGERGTWLIDLKIRSAAATDTCRFRSASIAPSTASPGSSAAATTRPEGRVAALSRAYEPFWRCPRRAARSARASEQQVTDKRHTSPALRDVHEGRIRVTESGHHRGDIGNGHIRPDPAGVLGSLAGARKPPRSAHPKSPAW